ncbi:MAG: SAM-dependent methyltransferase [Lachnospiraceae bacterium]|nr:SAM-dependent methyltransferase [Lachnospiraceae bacterium]
MDKLEQLLTRILNESLIQVTISGKKSGSREDGIIKIQIRPVRIKDRLLFQAARYGKDKVFHENLTSEETKIFIKEALKSYKQLQAKGDRYMASVLSGKKDNYSIKWKDMQEENRSSFSHDREKEYILSGDTPIPFLVDLGVQTKDGKIVKSKYDKFRQINRFLEYIRDILPELPKDREISVLDFGCGKSYLTFAMYYYLKILKGLDVSIIGLDLKEDVIKTCNDLKEKYGYHKLTFLTGDIGGYEGRTQVDMVVTLHACDTATDYAIAKAVAWNAKVILTVPCCQHELNGQIYNELMEPVFKHGLLKERMAALLTDGLRASLLEQAGYQVQVLEFIDMEHTPKNILLRCVRRDHIRPKQKETCEELSAFFHVQPTLLRLLKED